MGKKLSDLYGGTGSGAAWFQFENAWRSGKIPNVWEAIAATKPSRRLEYAVEFAMIDMEWRWRHNINNHERDVAHYIEMLKPLGLTSKSVMELVEHSFIVRSQWGDRPSIEDMLIDAPDTMQLRKMLQGALSSHFPVGVTVVRLGELLTQGTLGQVTRFGQQQSGDPEPFCVVKTDEGYRYVVAEQHHPRILPVSVEIVRIAAHSVELQHFGDSVGILIDQHTLKPDVVTTQELPMEITLDELAVHLAMSP